MESHETAIPFHEVMPQLGAELAVEHLVLDEGYWDRLREVCTDRDFVYIRERTLLQLADSGLVDELGEFLTQLRMPKERVAGYLDYARATAAGLELHSARAYIEQAQQVGRRSELFNELMFLSDQRTEQAADYLRPIASNTIAQRADTHLRKARSQGRWVTGWRERSLKQAHEDQKLAAALLRAKI